MLRTRIIHVVRHIAKPFRAALVQAYVKVLLFRRFHQLLRVPGVSFEREVKIDLFTDLEGSNRLGNRVNIQSTYVGFGSYIAEGSVLRHTRVGRFCSIGDSVKSGLGSHPSKDFVSTHPAFFSTKKQAGFSYVELDVFEELPTPTGEGYVVSIGNDVWIGSSVVILDGVRISDGAIIGANSTVTKDVPPYSVCVGSPARVIRHRFDETHRNFLSTFKWWDKEPAWIAKNARYFRSVEAFSDLFEHDNKP